MKSPEQEIQELRARLQEFENGVQAEQIMRSIAANSPSNIMMLDMDARIQYINHTVPGITPEEIMGVILPEIVEEKFRPGILNALERVAKSGEPDRYETSYTSPTGDFSWWESKVGPVIQDSVVTGYVVVSTNVTEQRRINEEQQLFFNLSVDMMCVADFKGYLKSVNQALKTTLGYEDELLDRPVFDFIHPDDIQSSKSTLSRLNKGEVIRDFNNRFRTADGSYRHFSWRAVADQKRETIYAVARDITETKNLEDQLQQSRKIEAVGQLAGGIAHDFNNLLTVIQGNIELAQQVPDLTESSLDNAIEAVSRATALTQQLLIFSRHKALSPEECDFNPLLNGLMSLLKRLLPENISINLETSRNIPYILADKSQIEQMIVNLCVNARDAMPEGGDLQLSVSKFNLNNVTNTTGSAPSGTYLQFSVTDTGCGMSPDVKSRIFEPFFTTKDVGKGTGLGLATVYGIVQKHNGFIDVESTPGQGTTFRVYLPTTKKTRSDLAPEEEKSIPVIGGDETILVAEDDSMVRKVVTRVLTQAGYKVITAKDGLDAVELFNRHINEISLALLDIVMPNLGGLDTAEQLRKQCPKLKVIFTSGYLQTEQDPARLEEEVILTKPYINEQLLKHVRQSLDNIN